MPRFQNREHAVGALRNAYGQYIREMYDANMHMKEIKEFLRHRIDLADLPDDLADKYAISDRAWNRFLLDIIHEAGVP